ncbi:MAG: SDR family NAD(P)-dependent oxidoreductase [Solirubrobacterales bacterium]
MAIPEPSSETTCLVTGASSGMGAEFARQLAARGHGVTLSARREEPMEELATELRDKHGTRVEVITCDVSEIDARDALIAEIADRGLQVDVLINNAGFATSGEFHELDGAGEVNQVRVDVEAVVALSHAFAVPMAERGRGAILNVASTAAFQPLPGMATYAACKAFVLSFSEALHRELGSKGVTVTALCPGPVRTEFAKVADAGEAESSTPDMLWMEPPEVVEAALSGLDGGDRRVLPGVFNRIGAYSGRYIPTGIVLRTARQFNPFTN